MASFSLSADLVKTLRRKAEAGGMLERAQFNQRPTAVRGQWLAKDKQTPLGEAFALELPADAPMEAYLPDGGLGHIAIVPGVQFDQAAPRGARYLELGSGEASHIVGRATMKMAGAAQSEAPRLFGAATARFEFPIFAERFTDSTRFFAAVRSLYDWIVTIPPFDEPLVRDHFALRAYYWRTDPTVGQCNTRDITYDCHNPPKSAVVLCGNNELAKARFGHLMLDRKYGLVLIDSLVRGGAGGMADHGYPAWATTAACPGEQWQAVALHEMGHALKLADEYLDSGRARDPSGNERNVAASDDIGSAPWKHRFSDQPASPSSRFSLDQQRAMAVGDLPMPRPDFVGLFQGARYRENYYRGSYNCLMKATNCLRFCPICATEIRAYFEA